MLNLAAHIRLAAAALLFAMAGACGGDPDDENRAGECFTNDECGGGACFLGACVDTGAGLGVIDIDVQPRDNSGALRQRLQRVFDVAAGAQDLYLAKTLDVVGTISHIGPPLNGMVRAYSIVGENCEPANTDNVQTYDGTVVGDVVAISVVPGRYRFVITPVTTSQALPPLAYPNNGACGVEVVDGFRLDAVYPNDSALVTVRGKLRYSVNDTTGVAGAQVTVRTSVESAGFFSATVETTSDGTFSVLLPDGGQSFAVDVKAGSNINVPTVTFPSLSRTGETLGDLNLSVSALVTVAVNVLDESGAPVPDASVVVNGQVGSGTIQLTTASNANGGVTLNLRAGNYTIVALPRRTASVGLARASLVVTDGAMQIPPLTLVAPGKAMVSGTVYDAGGVGVPNARVTYRLRSIKAERDVTATTSSDGVYTVMVDTLSPIASESAAEFEVFVEPATDSREARYRELVRADQASPVHDIGLYPVNFAFGRVFNADGGLISLASLLFYANLGGPEPVLLGSTQSTQDGEFTVPLPSPSFAQ